MYSFDNIRLTHLSHFPDLVGSFRELTRVVSGRMSDGPSSIPKNLDDIFRKNHQGAVNLQAEIGLPPAPDARELDREFHTAKDIFVGLCLKDAFLGAVIAANYMTVEELAGLADKSIAKKACVRTLQEAGLPALATIASHKLG